MRITEHTETKLILEPDKNLLLYNGLSVGGFFIFVALLMFGADFRTNPSYEITSAQNLNSFFKLVGILCILIGLAFSVTAINNQVKTYIFDKETSTFRITGRGLIALYKKEYPISSIKEVTIHKTTPLQRDRLPDNYNYISTDEFFISLGMENEIEIPRWFSFSTRAVNSN
jgi:hypothetical protein